MMWAFMDVLIKVKSTWNTWEAIGRRNELHFWDKSLGWIFPLQRLSWEEVSGFFSVHEILFPSWFTRFRLLGTVWRRPGRCRRFRRWPWSWSGCRCRRNRGTQMARRIQPRHRSSNKFDRRHWRCRKILDPLGSCTRQLFFENILIEFFVIQF